MSRSASPIEQITSTGIRIVGRAAADLAAQSRALAPTPPGPADLLWTARFRARPRTGGGSAVPAILTVLGDVLRAEWDACPAVTRDHPFSRPFDRLHGVTWDGMGEAGAWTGELLWRHRHPTMPAIACTTHLLVEEQQAVTTLTLSVAADGGLPGVRGTVGAGQARSPLLDPLRAALLLTADGFDGTPTLLGELEVEPFVRKVLLGETRSWPVAVLAPLEQGGFLLQPDQLATALFGIAPLYVLERHTCTFRLTDAIGDRRLSAYWGALRVYRPDFSCADRSEDHWLLLRERVDDPLELASLLGKVGRFAAERHAPISGLAERRETLTRKAHSALVTTPPAAAPAAAAATGSAAAGVGPAIPAEVTETLSYLRAATDGLTNQLRDLAGTIAHLATTNALLSDEIGRLRTTTAIRGAGSRAVERQLAAIESLLRPAPEPVDEGAESREREEAEAGPSLVEVVRQASSEYGDWLLILETAERTAEHSPYEDVERVAAVLQAMAQVARRRQEGGLETGLRAAFQEFGIDYRGGISKSTSERLRRQYLFTAPEGRELECGEHIALGGKTYDPKHCLRIYFTSRAPGESRFVIGHIGRHLTNMTTT